MACVLHVEKNRYSNPALPGRKVNRSNLLAHCSVSAHVRRASPAPAP
jgi:hypothetical protein